jgi:rhamnosyltransferase
MRVASITVAYNPEPRLLARQLDALSRQVRDMIVIDNGSAPPVEQVVRGLAPGARVTRLESNQGVARGFNIGIQEARSLGAQALLLLDQDSVPHEGMVTALERALEMQQRAGPVAAVGPRIRDPRDEQELPFVQLGWLRNRHMRPPDAEAVVPCDFLISSGTLMPLAAIDGLGPFEEGLFIDNVDLEWCFRARSRGYGLFGIGAAVLEHRLGERRKRVAGGAHIVVHSPERLYYMTRNRLLLYARGYVPLRWKLKDTMRVLAKFAATMLWLPPRGEYARMTWRALRDAFDGRTGRRA